MTDNNYQFTFFLLDTVSIFFLFVIISIFVHDR